MRLEAGLVHPSLAPVASDLVSQGKVDEIDLPRPQRLAAEALIALLGSARMPEEMAEYARKVNEMLDAEARFRADGRNEEWERLMESFRSAQAYARIVESARSGMACENGLMGLDSALDGAHDLIHGIGALRPEEVRTDGDLSEIRRLISEILTALRGSARPPYEMAGYVADLNATLDAVARLTDRHPLLAALRRASAAAHALQSAQSGSAEGVARDYFDLALDVAYATAQGHPLSKSPRRVART